MTKLQKWEAALTLYGLIKRAVLVVQDLLPGKEQGGESGQGEARLEKLFELLEGAASDIGQDINEIRPQVERVVQVVVGVFNKFNQWADRFSEFVGEFRKA